MAPKRHPALLLLLLAVFAAAPSLLCAASSAAGLSVLPAGFTGNAADRNAGLQAWGDLLGSSMVFNQAGDVTRASYALAHLVQLASMQIEMQSRALAGHAVPGLGGAMAKSKHLKKLQKAPREGESMLDKWARAFVDAVNSGAKKAAKAVVSGAKSALAGRNPFSAAQPAQPAPANEDDSTDELDLGPFISSADVIDIGDPKLYNYEWSPISSSLAGVEVEVNLFNIAPCAVLINARGVKVETTLIKVEPTLITVAPKGVNAEAALIEVAPNLISVSPQGTTLGFELPGHIHVEDAAIEVAPVGEEHEVGPGAP